MDAETPDQNLGPHISLYINDLRRAFRAAEELGVVYVNTRFSRRAYTEDEVRERARRPRALRVSSSLFRARRAQRASRGAPRADACPPTPCRHAAKTHA